MIDGPLAQSAAARGQRVVLPDRSACLAFTEEMADLTARTGLQAWVALPLRAADRILGSLTLAWRQPRWFDAAELALLAAFADQCAQTLERIQVRRAEQRAGRAARRMAEALQHSMLTAPPEPADLHIAVRYQPAAQDVQVGGDWYDAFPVAGATAIVIGDVAGHDRNAAATMGQLRNLLRGIAHALDEPPAAILRELDRALRELEWARWPRCCSPGSNATCPRASPPTACAGRAPGTCHHWSSMPTEPQTDEHGHIHDPPKPPHHHATRRRVARRCRRRWGQL